MAGQKGKEMSVGNLNVNNKHIYNKLVVGVLWDDNKSCGKREKTSQHHTKLLDIIQIQKEGTLKLPNVYPAFCRPLKVTPKPTHRCPCSLWHRQSPLVRHHFSQQTSCVMPLTLNVHPAEIRQSFPSIVLNTQHQSPVLIAWLSFNNKK